MSKDYNIPEQAFGVEFKAQLQAKIRELKKTISLTKADALANDMVIVHNDRTDQLINEIETLIEKLP